MKRSRTSRGGIATARQVRQAGGVNTNFGISLANSVSPVCVSRFFPLTETGTFTEVTDAKAGATLANFSGTSVIQEGEVPGTHVRLFQEVGVINDASWAAPGTADWLILAGFRSVTADAGIPYKNGSGSFYLGTGTSDARIRLHNYCVIFSNGSPDEYHQIATPVYYDGLRATEGHDYAVAACKRGTVLEHWLDGTLRGSVDTSIFAESIAIASALVDAEELDAGTFAEMESLYADFQDFDPNSPEIDLGHAAYDVVPRTIDIDGNALVGTPGGVWMPHLQKNAVVPGGYELPGFWFHYGDFAGGIINQAQDYTCLGWFIFPNGMPDDVGPATTWMRDNKRVWPGWITL